MKEIVLEWLASIAENRKKALILRCFKYNEFTFTDLSTYKEICVHLHEISEITDLIELPVLEEQVDDNDYPMKLSFEYNDVHFFGLLSAKEAKERKKKTYV